MTDYWLILNGSKTIRSDYGLACLFNELIQLRITVHENMNLFETVYK